MNYYKRHIGDYATDAGHLSLTEHGAYTVLMDRYYRAEEAPTRAEAIRWTRARTVEEIAAVDAVLVEFFTLDGDRYRQGRIDRELAAFHIKQEANRTLGARGGAANGKRIAKRTGSETLQFQEANGKPSHKPLATSHDKAEAKTKARPAGPSVAELLAEVDSVVVADFTAHRNAKRAAVTPTAILGIRREAHKAGMTLEAALQTMCERGWQGFKASWIEADAAARGPPGRPAAPSKQLTGVAGFLGVSAHDLLAEQQPRPAVVHQPDSGGPGGLVPAEPRRLPGE